MASVYGRQRAAYLSQEDRQQTMLIEGFDSDLLAVIKLEGDHQPNAQIRNAVGGETYVNAFRQRLTMVNVAAIEVRDGCDIQRRSASWKDLYRRYKLNGTSDDPLRISCGVVMVGRFNNVSFGTTEHRGFNTLQIRFGFLCNIPELDAVPEPEGSAADEFDDDVQRRIDEFENALDDKISSFNGRAGRSGSSSDAGGDNRGVLYGGAEIDVPIYDPETRRNIGTGRGRAVTSVYVPPNWRRAASPLIKVFGSKALS